jgi:hypothetical protein
VADPPAVLRSRRGNGDKWGGIWNHGEMARTNRNTPITSKTA